VGTSGVKNVPEIRKIACSISRIPTDTEASLKRAKKEQTFDPAVIMAVEAKLKALAVEHGSPTHTA
jgi:hypothetical protein